MHSRVSVVCSANTSAALRATFILGTSVDGLPIWPPYGHAPESYEDRALGRRRASVSRVMLCTGNVGMERRQGYATVVRGAGTRRPGSPY